MPARLHLALITLMTTAALAACKTSEPASVDPFGIADEGQGAKIDEMEEAEPNPDRRGESGGQSDREELSLPAPPESMAKTIDGDASDWDMTKARTFDGKRSVEKGEQFWSGDSDASFRVAVEHDAGHVYFLVEVRDDNVVDAGSNEVMTDGVILWLRDPELQTIVEALPASIRKRVGVRPEIAILFTPDGQYWRYDDQNGRLNRAGLDAQTQKIDGGYRVEIAIQASVLEYAAAFPMEEIAFRVELMDGDDAENRGRQTLFSMLPDTGADAPRYALLGLDGMVPHETVVGQPPRPNALGRWRLEDDTWSFRSFEAASANWQVYSDLEFVSEIVADTGATEAFCQPATTDKRVVEAYRSKGDSHMAALVYCATRAPKGQCPDDGAGQVLWVHFTRPNGPNWQHHATKSVLPEPLEQCYDADRGEGMYDGFSMVPVGMLNSTTWAVGWQHTEEGRGYEFVEQGIWFADMENAGETSHAGTVTTSEIDAKRDSRMVSRRRVYLTAIDNEDGADICSVEQLEDQRCDGLNRACRTPERRKQRKVQIWTWAEDKGKFEKFFLTKHRNCKTDFDFASRKAYLLLQREGRLGLVASPALRE
ncbi:MAG: sugar-binding protein [Myxococcota bacterium]